MELFFSPRTVSTLGKKLAKQAKSVNSLKEYPSNQVLGSKMFIFQLVALVLLRCLHRMKF